MMTPSIMIFRIKALILTFTINYSQHDDTEQMLRVAKFIVMPNVIMVSVVAPGALRRSSQQPRQFHTLLFGITTRRNKLDRFPTASIYNLKKYVTRCCVGLAENAPA
jgi:hypothetical protein